MRDPQADAPPPRRAGLSPDAPSRGAPPSAGPPPNAPARAAPSRRGLHVGPLRITPTRIMLVIAIVGSVAYLAYAITVREATQIPMLASGAAVLGIVFSALAVAGAVATYRAARDDRPGSSVAAAVVGGIAGIVAFACFAVAAVLALLSSATG